MHGFTWLTSLEMLIYPRTGYDISTVVMNGGEAMKVSMDNNGGWRDGGFTIREPVGMPGVVTRFEYLALARDRERAAAKESAPIKDKPIYLPRVSGRQ